MHRALVLACLAVAVASAEPAAMPPPPELRVPKAAGPPRVDAAADDPAWAGAAWIAALPLVHNSGPRDIAPPTRVAVTWTEEALHLRFVCQDEAPLAWSERRDDHQYKGDVCEVFLDPVGDARWFAELQVAPNNAVFDQYIALTAEPRSGAEGLIDGTVRNRDYWPVLTWDLERLRTATARTADGWIADLAIPGPGILRRLGTRTFASGMRLKANLLRYDWQPAQREDPRRLVAVAWSTVMHGCPHLSPQRMGTLVLE